MKFSAIEPHIFFEISFFINGRVIIGQCFITWAVPVVIVYDPAGLQMRIDNYRTHKFKAAAL